MVCVLFHFRIYLSYPCVYTCRNNNLFILNIRICIQSSLVHVKIVSKIFSLAIIIFSFPLIFLENHFSCFLFFFSPDSSFLHFWSASSSILSKASSSSLSLSLIEDNKSWSWYRVRVLVVFHHQPFTALLCLNPVWLLPETYFTINSILTSLYEPLSWRIR